ERLHNAHRLEGQLLLTHYERMGGLAGALDSALREVMSKARICRDLPNGRQALESLMRQAMIPHLCRVNEADEFAKRVARLEEIPLSARPLIELLIQQRLIVSDRRRDGEFEYDVVEIAHEALLREWPLLSRWLSEEREYLVLRTDIERVYNRWM